MKNLIFYLSYLCFCIPIFGQYQITVVRSQELSLRSIHIWNDEFSNREGYELRREATRSACHT